MANSTEHGELPAMQSCTEEPRISSTSLLESTGLLILRIQHPVLYFNTIFNVNISLFHFRCPSLKIPNLQNPKITDLFTSRRLFLRPDFTLTGGLLPPLSCVAMNDTRLEHKWETDDVERLLRLVFPESYDC